MHDILNHEIIEILMVRIEVGETESGDEVAERWFLDIVEDACCDELTENSY